MYLLIHSTVQSFLENYPDISDDVTNQPLDKALYESGLKIDLCWGDQHEAANGCPAWSSPHCPAFLCSSQQCSMGFNIKYIWRSKLPRSFLQIFREVRREIIYIFPSFHFNGKSLSIAAPASYSFRQPKSFGTRILWGAADLPSWIENHQVQKVSFLPTYPIISNSKNASLVKYWPR